MDYRKLDNIIEKFWDGRATESEEKQLLTAFQNDELDNAHQELIEYFKFMESHRNSKRLDEQFDLEMLANVNSTSVSSKPLFGFLKIAAVVVIFFGISFFVYNKMDSPKGNEVSEFVDTYEDSELAFAEVKNALMLVSTTINDGMQHAEKLSEFHKATEELEHSPSK